METARDSAPPRHLRSIVPELLPRIEREAERCDLLWEESAALHRRCVAVRRRTIRTLAEARAAIERSQAIRAAAAARRHPKIEAGGGRDHAG